MVIHVQLTEQHLGQVHCRLQDLGVREGADVQNHLNVLLLDEVSTHQGFLRTLFGEPDSLIDTQKPEQGILPDPVVDIHSVCQTLDIELLSRVEVTHLELHLESLEIVDVLEQVVLPE